MRIEEGRMATDYNETLMLIVKKDASTEMVILIIRHKISWWEKSDG